MAIAYLSDRVRHRFAFCIFPIAIACVGFGILLNVHGDDRQNLQYGALFLVTMGAYSAMPIIVCWFVTNLSGHKRRAIGTGWQIGFGNSKISLPPFFFPVPFILKFTPSSSSVIPSTDQPSRCFQSAV